ncbi:transposable element Tcb2 transposase [Trichonephila clavipes]|nr:transposable element Tcb2 transposase [Trichonephila clavipes]
MTRYLPSNIRGIDNYKSRDWMVWAGITLDGHTHRYVFAGGTVAAVRSQREAHRAALVDDFLEIEDMHRIDWPLRSADHIRIEHVCDVPGMVIASPKPLPRTIQGPKTEFLNEWD